MYEGSGCDLHSEFDISTALLHYCINGPRETRGEAYILDRVSVIRSGRNPRTGEDIFGTYVLIGKRKGLVSGVQRSLVSMPCQVRVLHTTCQMLVY